MKIGFLDSGLGGAHLLYTIRAKWPGHDYEFYGDTANMPYGDKDVIEISKLLDAGLNYLLERGCDMIVIACNTASSVYLERGSHETNILELLGPTAEAVSISGVEKPLLLATPRTISSGLYKKLISKNLISIPMPTLAKSIEDGELERALQDVVSAVEPYKDEIDSIILGCTHYSLIKEEIRKVFPNLIIFSQDEILPNVLEKIISQEPRVGEKGGLNFYLTGQGADRFDRIFSKR